MDAKLSNLIGLRNPCLLMARLAAQYEFNSHTLGEPFKPLDRKKERKKENQTKKNQKENPKNIGTLD